LGFDEGLSKPHDASEGRRVRGAGAGAGAQGCAEAARQAKFAGHPAQHEPNAVDGGAMEPAAIVTFAVIASFVWGGFILVLVRAVRREREKKGEE
jgi:hypothetical protein